MKKKIFILLVFSVLISCQNKVQDIYDIYPKGRHLSKNDLEYMNAIYVVNNENIAMKMNLGRMRGIDYYMPHILFFDSTLTLNNASYFPFTVDSLINNKFYCKYTDEDWKKIAKGYRNDLPSFIDISSTYDDGHSNVSYTGLILDDILMNEFPIISLSVMNGFSTDTLRAPSDRFEFYIWRKANPKGVRGRIKIFHKENMFSSKYSNRSPISIDIYEEKLIDNFYDNLWVKLQEMKNDINGSVR